MTDRLVSETGEVVTNKLELYDFKVEWLPESSIKRHPSRHFDPRDNSEVYVSNAKPGMWMKLTPKPMEDGKPRYEYSKDVSGLHFGAWKSTEVLLMRDRKTDKLVAAKSSNPYLNRNTLSEARLLASFSHPNIQTIHDIAMTNDDDPQERKIYFIGEYLPGGTLKDWNNTDRTLTEISSIIDQIASGISYLHEHGRIHADLKPIQIVFDDNENPKIIDMDPNIGGFMDKNGKCRGDAGNNVYQPPERHIRDLSQQTDIYAFGAIVFELVAGFEGEDSVTISIVRDQFVDGEAPIPVRRSLWPRLSEEPQLHQKLSQVVKKALAEKPEERFKSIDEFNGELQDIFRQLK